MFEQRGGIWGEAARKASELATEPLQGEPAPESAEETVVFEGSDNLDEALATSDPNLRQRTPRRRRDSDSASTVTAPAALDQTPVDASGSPPVSSSTFSLSSWASGSDRTSRFDGLGKRKTWFGSGNAKQTSNSPTSSTSSLPRKWGFPDGNESESEPATAAARLRDVLQTDLSRTTSTSSSPPNTAGTSRGTSPVRDSELVNGTISSSVDLLSNVNTSSEDLGSVKAVAVDEVSIPSPADGSGLVKAEIPVSPASTTPLPILAPAAVCEMEDETLPRVEEADQPPLSATPLNDQTTTPPPVLENQIPSMQAESPRPVSTARSPFLPPPPRRALHQASHSTPDGSATSTASLLGAWRSRTADKQALAASVNQAKDVMKRWGANWNAIRKQGAEDDVNESSDPSLEQLPLGLEADDRESTSRRASGSRRGSAEAEGDIDGRPTYKDYRIGAKGKMDTLPDMASQAARRTSVGSGGRGLFVPPPPHTTTSLNIAPSTSPPPATSLGDVGGFGVSPPSGARSTSPNASSPIAAYQRAPTMAIPGISDPRCVFRI